MNEFRDVMSWAEKIHEIYHAFCNHMKRWYSSGDGFDCTQMIGWKAMRRCEKYAKKHPEIRFAYVDDNMFTPSMIVLVPHPTMGITCIYIPQLASEQNTFFLYPNHIQFLCEALEIIKEDFSIERQFDLLGESKVKESADD